MMKSLIPCRKKTGSNNHRRRPFKEYHEEWFDLLKNRLLPSLRRAMHESSVAQLSTHVDILRHHLTSYYDALDLSAASDDVAHLLHPSAWRTPFETPFLWLGDLHPYLFTNLLRSFLSDDDENDENDDVFQSANLRNRFLLNNNNNNDVNELFIRPWHIVMAWRNPPASLMARIEQIECGVRLMVPALAERARKAQERFVQTVAGDYWGGRRRRDKEEEEEEEAGKAMMGKAVMVEMDEMVGVLVDANRLRRSVLAEIIGATSVYQAALFLEGLAQFLVGFRDPDLVAEFQACKTPLN